MNTRPTCRIIFYQTGAAGMVESDKLDTPFCYRVKFSIFLPVKLHLYRM